MNTSYLGQVFQKEVGCSFSQYLSNIKNEKAKDMILNTNMKINDIARKWDTWMPAIFTENLNSAMGFLLLLAGE